MKTEERVKESWEMKEKEEWLVTYFPQWFDELVPSMDTLKATLKGLARVTVSAAQLH